MASNVPLAEQSVVTPIPARSDDAVNRKARVLLVITRLTTGGDTTVVLDIATHLNRQPQFEVHLAAGPVATYEQDLTHLAHERDIPTAIIPDLINRISPWRNLRGLWELRQLMKSGQYDIVHTHSSVAGVVGRLAAVSADVPVILHHVHGWGIQKGMPARTRLLYLWLERFCGRFTDRLIAVSKPTIEKGLKYHLCPAEKFALVYYGIDLQAFRRPVDATLKRAELGLDVSSKLIGMIGRLNTQKNPQQFIRAAAMVAEEYRSVQFVLVGEGPLRTECEDLIADLKLKDKLFLLGFRSDVQEIMPILTLTVMSSLWEGLPFVFLESMSAGKPIVANDVDGARDVIVEGKTGYLVAPHNPRQMADRILYLLNNEAQCAEMGLTARRHSERFSTQQMVAEIESLYRDEMVRAERVGSETSHELLT